MSHQEERSGGRAPYTGRAVGALPTGTVTFLFTDIEGSTKILRELGSRYTAALAEHRRILREAFGRHGGVEVDTQGDAFFVVFASASDAAVAAGEGQAALEAGPIRVRMGLHTGRPEVSDEGYTGLDVHLGARIAGSGHGGQVVLSGETRNLLGEAVPMLDLGEHRLKDFDQAVQMFQLGDALFPPLKTISNTNLPRPASSFVGRRHEVRDVVRLVKDSARLVTMTGPGGTGKTRLAIEAASELVPDYKAGVFWVGLATVGDPDRVLETVGQTLGAGDDVTGHIGEREMLLLLDNFEQVVDAAPGLPELLEACPNLNLLVTSRELLRVRGEVEYAVPPLADPEAVDLFCTRAQMEPTGEIAQLCARLDNLPLAVELAAARTKLLTPRQILERLSERLDLFRGGRDAEARQATLRATIAWSHDLLSPEEQRLFARLAVFAGGCTLESAQAVCDADQDTLQSLVEKSLVRRTEDRFWMLETIREFAVERLAASEEADELRRRHFDRFLDVAEAANLSDDSEGVQRHDLVLPDMDNVRAAIDGAVPVDIEGALRLTSALENVWVTQNPFEGSRRFATLLEAATAVPDRLRARALRQLGGTRFMSGDREGADEAYEQSLALFRAIGDETGVAQILHRLGLSAVLDYDLTRARSLQEESLAMIRRIGGPREREAEALQALGEIEFREGNHQAALELTRQAAEIAIETGHRWWQAICVGYLGDYHLLLRHFDDAERLGRESLDLMHQVGDRQNIVYGLGMLARSASARGDVRRAGILWGAIEAEEARGQVGAWEQEREAHAASVVDGSPEFEQGRTEGRRLSLDEAVELGVGG